MPSVRDSGDRAAHPSDLPEVLRFMQLLWAVAHGLERTSKRMTSQVGVTGPQRLVLRVVGLFPGMAAGQLAAILHVHPSTLTGILQRLTRQRLVARADDARDRRRAVLRLTARGMRVNAVTGGTVESAIAEALVRTSARDRAATRRVLEGVARHLQIPAPHDLAVATRASVLPAQGQSSKSTSKRKAGRTMLK